MYARLGWNSKISAEHESEMPVLYNPKSNTHTQKLITKDGWASIAMYNIQCAMRINEFKFNGRILPQCIQSSKVAWSRLLYISLKQQHTKYVHIRRVYVFFGFYSTYLQNIAYIIPDEIYGLLKPNDQIRSNVYRALSSVFEFYRTLRMSIYLKKKSKSV